MDNSPTTANASDAGAITTDLPCMACGYNLRGLRDGGTCPECGAGIAESVAARGGLVGDDRWGWRVVDGVRLLLWLPIVLPAAYGLVTWQVMRMMGHGRPAGVVYVVYLIAVTATMLLGTAGTMLITTPTGNPASRTMEVWRVTARWAVGTAVAALVLGVMLPRMRHDPAIWQYEALCVVAVAITCAAVGMHTSAVAARLGAARLARGLRASLIVLGGVVLLFGGGWFHHGRPAMADLALIYLALLVACGSLWMFRGALRSRLGPRARSR